MCSAMFNCAVPAFRMIEWALELWIYFPVKGSGRARLNNGVKALTQQCRKFFVIFSTEMRSSQKK